MIPPRQARFDQLITQIDPIGQEHITDGVPVSALLTGHDGDRLPEAKGRGELFGLLAEGLLLFWAVNALQANPFGLAVMQDFDSITVEDRHDFAGEGEASSFNRRREEEQGEQNG